MIIEDKLLKQVLFGINDLGYFDEFDLSNPDFIEALSKIKILLINRVKPPLTKETISELQQVLKHMTSLEQLTVHSSKERFDISPIFDSLLDSLQRISLSGLDFSEDPDLEKFNKLKYISIDRSNLSSIPNPSSSEDCLISLGKDLPNIPNEVIIEEVIKGKKIATLNEELRKVLSGLSRTSSIPLNSYEIYYDQIRKAKGKDLSLSIPNVSKLSKERLEFLVKVNPNIKHIFVEYGAEFKSDEPKYQYTVDEYCQIRSKIDEIISQINIPSQDDPDREKKIFAQIYAILGRQIDYDHFAITDEGKKDEQLCVDCRDLKNAFLGVERNGKREQLAVCAGIADALGNVASCFGIKSESIKTLSEAEMEQHGGAWEEKRNEKGEIVRRNGTTDPMGHAYNIVELDGKKYYCDLTWDMSTIKENRIPLANFLKSADEFLESHKDEGFYEKIADKSADESFPYEKQMKLFKESGIQLGDEKQQDILTINQMLNENYLCGFLHEYVEYVKHGRSSITYTELKQIFESVEFVEQSILAYRGANDKKFQISNNDGSIGFSYTFKMSNPITLQKLRDEINRRRRDIDGH